MATVGNIVAQFTADTGGLKKGVEDAVSYFEGLRKQIAGASDEIKKFNSVLSAQVAVASAALNKMNVEKSIRINADVTDLKTAIESADKLAADAMKNVASVSVSADTSEVSTAIDEISEKKPVEVKADTKSLSTATGIVKQFGSTASELFSRSGEDAVEGAERFDSIRSAATNMVGGVTSAYSSIKAASNQTASAVNAIGAAASSISEAGQSGFQGFAKATDSTVVAVGRSYDAAKNLAKTYKETVPAAATASVAGFRGFVAQLGGVNTLARAAGGSAAATAVTVGSLSGAFASAAASVGAYAAVVTAAKVASSGMSEEAQAYVERGAQVVGAFVGVRAGAAASAAAYKLTAGALYSSATATQFFQKMLQGLGQGITETVARSVSLVNGLTQIQSVLSLVSAASDKATTAAGFASLAVRVAATSVLFGALAGGVRAYAAGTAVATGVTTGASGAIAGLASTFPLAAVGAMAAAVATGKFFHALEHLSVATQSLDQMAERFGTTTQEMEKLKLAADNTQVSMRMLAKGQQSFYQNLSKIKSGQFNTENVREAKIAFDKLGISAEEIKNKKPDEAFRLVAEELSKVQDAAKRTSIAMDLFGRMGAMILPALKELGEIEQDFKRLGGALNSLDTKRLLDVENSFDRVAFAGKSLNRTLLIPFVELQKAFNNFAAEIRGGLSAAMAPLASMLADISKPLAVIIEIVGRVINIFLRMVAVVVQVAVAIQAFSTFVAIFEGIRAGFDAAMKPLEMFVEGAAELASGFAALMRPAGEFTGVLSLFGVAVRGFGTAIGVALASLSQLAIYIAAGAATWGVYTVAITIASKASLMAAVNFAIAWAAALGPITIVVGALAAVGAAVTYLGSGLVSAGKWAYGLAKSFMGFKDAPKEIDAARASVDELAAASQVAAAFRGERVPAFEQVKQSVADAREEINELTIESARYGSEGAAAAQAAQEGFSDLQKGLSNGTLSLEEFNAQTKRNAENLRENLKSYKDDSPAITLKKNLELYKQLNDAAKAATKATRDIGAGTVIEDKFFPTSETIKAKAAQYKAEYVKALEEIKKKQQTGVFAKELEQKKSKNLEDLNAGRISAEQYETVKLELDSTNAQEQASIAAEEIKREFDRKNKIDIELDMSFAEGIRKSLDDAFLSPVQKFEKELEKINSNKSLTDSEKIMARADLGKRTTEGLVGKSAQSQFQERRRDLNQAADAGLIGRDKLKAELEKASEDFAKAVGVTQTPFEAFASSTKNIASQFGMAGQPLDQVREKLKGNAEQLAMFDRAVKESRDNLLQSLGIEKTPQAIFDEQMKKIDEALANKSITGDQAADARENATRKRDEALGAGSNLAGQFADRQRKIEEAYGGGKDPAKMAIAQNKLDMDRRSAAGLEATPAQALQAGVDKINDAFGEAGKGTEEYKEAIKKNSDSVKASLGVEKTGAEKIAEARTRLAKAVDDNVISDEERNKAIKQQRDGLLSSLGIKKTPSQDFEDAVQRIKENASELNPDEIAKGLKEAKDNLLSSLGIDKSPAEQTEDAMKKLREAFGKGQISAEEFAKGSQKARDSLLQSLGIPLDPVKQLRQRMNDLNEAMSKGQLTDEEFKRGQEEARRSMIPGGEEEGPVKKFQRDLKAINDAAGEGLIDPNDAALRKANLQAQLQQDLKPSLDKVAPDRRGVEGADTRSKAGVDTFFRILRGNDNPSLKAQLETARNTKLLAEALKDPDVAPVIAQLAIR